MCGDNLGLAYTITATINGSYPSFTGRTVRNEGSCRDVETFNLFGKSAFVMVPNTNLTSLVFYNFKGQRLLRMSLIRMIKWNQAVSSDRAQVNQNVPVRQQMT